MRAHRCDHDVSFVIGKRRYDVNVNSYHPGSPASREDPGDGPEISIANIITVDDEEVVTYETFLLEFAVFRGMSLEEAENHVTDYATQRTDEYFSDREDDAREDQGWRDE